MSLFNWGKKKGVQRAPFTSNILQRLTANNYSPLASKDHLREYRNWVYACVNARAEEVGNIKLILKKNGEVVPNHEVLDLINKVNSSMTKFELFEATQSFKDLDGNAFWYLARDKDGAGAVQEIYILRPDKMKIVIDQSNPLLVQGYVYSMPDGKLIPFKPNEILHHKNFDPTANHPFPHKGMGVVQAAAFAIDTDNEARAWNLNFFKNGARPDGLLITDGESAMDAGEYKRLQEEWKEEHGGSGNSHKMAILSGGLKYQELTRNQKDMDFLGQRTFSRDEILALFRTPKSIIGITDDVTRANADAAIYVFALRTIKPLMQKLVDTINEFLLPEFGDGLRLEFVSPVPEDRVAAAAYYAVAHNKWLSTNDIRRAEAMETTENGEKLYGQMGQEEIDSTPVPDPIKSIGPKKKGKKGSTPSTPVTPVAEKKNMTPGEQAVAGFIAKMPATKQEVNATRKGLTTEEKTAHIEAWKKRMGNTGPLKKKIDAFFTAQEKEVRNNVSDELKGLESKEFQFKSIDDMLFDNEKALKASINLITPFIEQYIRESGAAGNAAADGDGFDDGSKDVLKFIPKRAEYYAETINGTTREDLLKKIKDAIDAGASPDEISQVVADVYEKARDFRTDMIARTEVAASSNFGATQGYLQAGVTEHQWIVVFPEDEDCLENDGVIVGIGDAFPNGDTEPPVHPNCQCTTVPIFD